MMHTWAQATDGTGSAVRVVCLDYRKAFDLEDHGTLAAKIMGLRIPRGGCPLGLPFPLWIGASE